MNQNGEADFGERREEGWREREPGREAGKGAGGISFLKFFCGVGNPVFWEGMGVTREGARGRKLGRYSTDRSRSGQQTAFRWKTIGRNECKNTHT